jgi:hypothetical protein
MHKILVSSALARKGSVTVEDSEDSDDSDDEDDPSPAARTTLPRPDRCDSQENHGRCDSPPMQK